MSRENTKMSVKVEGSVVEMTFSNGEVREFDVHHSHSLYHRFAVNGAVEKLRNKISATKTPEEAVQAIDDLLAAFEKGEWATRAEAGESTPAPGLLAQALAVLSGKSVPDCQEFVSSLDKKQQAAMRKEPNVAREIDKLRKPITKAAPEAVQNALASFLGA